MFKKYRIKAGLTQEKLAEQVEISWRQIQRIEMGKNEPSIKTFRKLIKILKISEKDILKYLKLSSKKKKNSKKQTETKTKKKTNAKPKTKKKAKKKNN